jgi:hypothetical protein
MMMMAEKIKNNILESISIAQEKMESISIAENTNRERPKKERESRRKNSSIICCTRDIRCCCCCFLCFFVRFLPDPCWLYSKLSRITYRQQRTTIEYGESISSLDFFEYYLFFLPFVQTPSRFVVPRVNVWRSKSL